MTITLTLNPKTLTESQSISASSFVKSVTDSAKRSITEYSVYDSGADGGYFMLNGVALSDGAWHTLTAAQFAQLVYVAGSSAGTDTVEIKAYDGKTWSSAYSTKETTTAPSSPTTPVSLLEELGFTATAAAALITASGSPTYSGSLTYNNMLAILNQAAVGGMTATKFSALQSLASMLNQSGGLSTSAYVQQIADDVINGNSANASWNGGSSTATKLGNLSATSTQTQVDDLIDKWFLGTDLPSLSVSAIGESNYNPTYQTSALPLFNPNTNAPSYLDVNQGYLGDCYFVAALGEVALQDPSAIENMITDNGNGTYSVLFYVNGQPDYVTVNGELPYMSGGYQWANGSTQEFANGTLDDWVALVEKAFVELNEQTSAASYGGHTTGNAYEDVNGGTAITLSEITDQTFNTYNLSPSESTSSLNSLASILAADFAAGDDIILSTPTADNGNLVGDHMFIVTGVTSAGAISIQNPWNSAYSGSLQMSFTDTLKQLAADNVSIYVTTGTAVA
jgi:hypothetical protein